MPRRSCLKKICLQLPFWIAAAANIAWVPTPIGSDGLPTSGDVEHFFNFTNKLDLSDPSVQFKAGTGGMSIHLQYTTPDGQTGDFLSTNADGRGDNEAGNPEGQILSYNLARIFGYASDFGSGRWYKLSGYPVTVLRQLAQNSTSTAHQTQEARDRILQTTLNSEVSGSLSLYGPRPYEFLVLESRGGPNGLFNTSAPIAQTILATGPRPQDRMVTMGKYSLNELKSARLLSAIFMVDALSGQYDRFSGGNINVVKEGDHYKIVAYDNNGSAVLTWGRGYIPMYMAWTTRYDKDVADKIIAMDAFVNGSASSFMGFTDRAQFLSRLGLRSWTKYFRDALSKVAAGVRANVAAQGQNAYF